MPHRAGAATPAADAKRIAERGLSFRDFVDDALYHPAWGYYGAGRVRFGDGGHYDTYPLALSPIFGRMLAESALRVWRRGGRPDEFEICELGAGNGQLCADALIWIAEMSRHEADWHRFAELCRYRIVERSRALIDRQRQVLGPLSDRVVWTCQDLARVERRGGPLAPCGLVFANEVLDALSHHKVVANGGKPMVAFVLARERKNSRGPSGRIVARSKLARRLANGDGRSRLAFEEVLLPLGAVRGLEPFLRRYCPELFARAAAARLPYFACTDFERLLRNTSRLYTQGEIWWIDYGAERAFHHSTPEGRRVFAGPPRSGHSVYDRPGEDDITFLVDFSTVAAAANRAGLRVDFYGSQGELARRSGVPLDRRAANLIVRARAVGWLLAVVGVGPEREWKHGALGWGESDGRIESVRSYVRRSIDEFTGKLATDFKLMILSKAREPRAKVAGRRA